MKKSKVQVKKEHKELKNYKIVGFLEDGTPIESLSNESKLSLAQCIKGVLEYVNLKSLPESEREWVEISSIKTSSGYTVKGYTLSDRN